mgnify:CR=1 FL=1
MTPTALANLDHEAEDDAGEDRAGPVRAGNMRGSTTIASAATAPTDEASEVGCERDPRRLSHGVPCSWDSPVQRGETLVSKRAQKLAN